VEIGDFEKIALNNVTSIIAFMTKLNKIVKKDNADKQTNELSKILLIFKPSRPFHEQ
jgi:hypothetical protein